MHQLRNYILTVFTISIIGFAFGQTKFNQNCIYTEIGGNGFFGSLNYEHQFAKQPGLGIHAGLGFYSDAFFHFTFPVGINYLFKLKSEKSFVDAGLGGTWTTSEETLIGANRKGKGSVYGNLMINIGYRRHTSKNLMWRFNVMAVKNQFGVGPWLGVAIGKRF